MYSSPSGHGETLQASASKQEEEDPALGDPESSDESDNNDANIDRLIAPTRHLVVSQKNSLPSPFCLVFDDTPSLYQTHSFRKMISNFTDLHRSLDWRQSGLRQLLVMNDGTKSNKSRLLQLLHISIGRVTSQPKYQFRGLSTISTLLAFEPYFKKLNAYLKLDYWTYFSNSLRLGGFVSFQSSSFVICTALSAFRQLRSHQSQGTIPLCYIMPS